MSIVRYSKFIKESTEFDFSSSDKYNDHINKLNSDKEYLKRWQNHKLHKLKEWWSKLKPFEDSSDVPKLPNPLDDFFINRLIQLGAIPKSELKKGQWYYGNYRSSKFGKWDSEKSVFHHIRYSFSYYWDDCNHFEDDNSFALFVPIREATEEEIKNELKKVETSK